MALRHGTFHDFVWDYDFALPALDVQRDFRTQQPGRFSRLIGVDGRYSGRLKRFPGWKKVAALTLTDPDEGNAAITLGGFDGLTLPRPFMPFAIQKGASGSSIIRGVLFLGESAGSTKLYAYFSDNGGALAVREVHDFGTTTLRPAVLDVTMDQQLLYIVGEDTATPPGRIELLARYTGSDNHWKSASWDSISPPVLSITDSNTRTLFSTDSDAAPAETKPGHLEAGEPYGLAYRFVFPEQGFVGALSAPQEFSVADTAVSIAAGHSIFPAARHIFLPPLSLPSGYGNIFSRAIVQVFRTPWREIDVAGARGGLFLEAEWEIPRETDTSPMTSNFDPSTDLTDTQVTPDSDIAGWNLAKGDTIYLQVPVKTNDAADISASAPDFGFAIYRRTVTDFTAIGGAGADTITFDQGVRPSALSIATGGVLWISKTGDGSDSTGVLQDPAAGGSSRPIYVGWRPEISSDAGENFTVPDTPRGLDDDALILQPNLRSDEFSTFAAKGNPRAKFIHEYENIFIRVTTGSKEAGGHEVLRWGFTSKPRKGLMPVLNRRRLTDLTDRIEGLIKADPFLVVLLNNGLLRIHKSGERLAVDPIHNRFGSAAFKSAVVVGTNLYIASETGILLVDLTTGQVDSLNATQPFFIEGVSGDGVSGDWRGDLSSIEGAYDAQLGALMFLNTVKSELLIIWLNYGVFTHMIDVPFDRLITSGNLQSGGLRRALFFNDTAAKFYEISADRSADSRTTFSYEDDGTETSADLSYNGTTTSASAGKLIDSTATFHAEMVGHFVRVRQSDGVWKRAKITARDSGTQLAIDADIAASGLVYAVGGIPMQFTAWPLSGNPEQPVLDLFSVKKVTAMGAAVAGVGPSGRTLSSTFDLLRYQLFERCHALATATASAGDANTSTAEIAIDDDENARNFKAIQRNHSILVPGLELWSSNLDIDLLGLVVQGKIEGSFKDTRPA